MKIEDIKNGATFRKPLGMGGFQYAVLLQDNPDARTKPTFTFWVVQRNALYAFQKRMYDKDALAMLTKTSKTEVAWELQPQTLNQLFYGND